MPLDIIEPMPIIEPPIIEPPIIEPPIIDPMPIIEPIIEPVLCVGCGEEAKG